MVKYFFPQNGHIWGGMLPEVTPKASSTCENEAEGVQRRPSTKRALFSDQYSDLEDENNQSDIPSR